MRCEECLAAADSGEAGEEELTTASAVWEKRKSKIYEALATRAQNGDVQAAKLLLEAAKREEDAGRGSERGDHIDDYVVDPGTIVDTQ